jgi:hypothetical protein
MHQEGSPWIFAHRHLVGTYSLDGLDMTESGTTRLAAEAEVKETLR